MCPLDRISPRLRKGQTTCPLCHEPVCLEGCKTDEDGRAIHEDCYVRKVCSGVIGVGRDFQLDSAG